MRPLADGGGRGAADRTAPQCRRTVITEPEAGGGSVGEHGTTALYGGLRRAPATHASGGSGFVPWCRSPLTVSLNIYPQIYQCTFSLNNCKAILRLASLDNNDHKAVIPVSYSSKGTCQVSTGALISSWGHWLHAYIFFNRALLVCMCVGGGACMLPCTDECACM